MKSGHAEGDHPDDAEKNDGAGEPEVSKLMDPNIVVRVGDGPKHVGELQEENGGQIGGCLRRVKGVA